MCNSFLTPKEYQKRANALMSEWKDADAAYKASHGPVDADAKVSAFDLPV